MSRSRSRFLYHMNSTEGVIFNDDLPDEIHAKNGWVDNPAKLGINPWGQDSAGDVEVMKSRFLKHQVPAIDPPRASSMSDMKNEIERLRAKNAALENLRTYSKIDDKAKHSAEELADEESDARKEANKLAGIPMSLPGDAPIPKKLSMNVEADITLDSGTKPVTDSGIKPVTDSGIKPVAKKESVKKSAKSSVKL